MRHVLLIHNPYAARVRRHRLDTVLGVLGKAGCRVDVVSPQDPRHTVTLAQEGVKEGVDVVAVYGGDGTMMLAVEGMIGSSVPLALIPGGTGNLLAGNLRIPRRPAGAAEVVAHGRPRRIDLGRLESEDGVRYFAVASGAGFDAELMTGTGGSAKRRWGMAAYVAHTIRTLGRIRSTEYRLEIDDEVQTVRAATVLVANCRTIVPPMLHLGPDIRIDDGALDVVALNANSWWQAFAVVGELLRGGSGGSRVHRFRGRRVTVTAEPTAPVQLDGEPHGATPFSAEIIPGGLEVLVPA